VFRDTVSRNSHSRAGCSISDPGSDYSHQYRALVLEISARGRLVLPYSCPRRDDDVGPRKTVVRTDGWEPWPHARARQHQTQGKPPGQIPSQQYWVLILQVRRTSWPGVMLMRELPCSNSKQSGEYWYSKYSIWNQANLSKPVPTLQSTQG